ncbi:MAG: permease-like cell division protein FtsX [Pseudomonadales bacterium]
MARTKAARDPWPRQRQGFLALGRDHARIFRETGHFVAEKLGTSLLVWVLVGIALALPAGLFLLQQNLAAMTGAWEGRPGLTVYFEVGVDPQAVTELAAALEDRSAVAAVTVISEADALAEFQRFSGLADALELLDENPLPASLRAVLEPGTGAADLDALAALAQAADAVAEVVVEKTWLERLTDITRVVSRLGVMLGGLFGLGAVLITATSVRLAIEARLEEMRVLKLVGATDAQIRRPFLYFGLVYGLGGGLVAAMLISIALLVIEGPLTDLVGSYGQQLEVAGFDLGFLAGLFGAAGVLGVGGALIAVRQRLADLEVV